MDLVQRITNTAFLGGEFLTWLWYHAEHQEGRFKLGERYIEVYFDAKLVLEATGDIRETSSIKSECPTETEEARASLQSGKHVAEARLRVVAEQKQWTATVKANDLSLNGVKIPALLSREDDDKVYERLYLLEEIEDLLDDLFDRFLDVRLDEANWDTEVDVLRAWVQPA
ncbi:MAG: hypothetical protein QF464_09140 [Myxococcota bacterium]|nr:hypothetical protein [Myxococcota bacterium]